MAEPSSDDPGPIIATTTTNADGWFLAVSPQFLELIGRPVEALAGVNVADLVHPMQASAVRRALAEAAGLTATAATYAHTRLLVVGDVWRPIVLSVQPAVDDRILLGIHEPEPAPADVASEGSYGPASDQPLSTHAVEAAQSAMVAAEGSPDQTREQPLVVQPDDGTNDVPLPGEVVPDFPYEDSEAHMAYVALMPADTVPEQRDAVRRSAGDESTPMIEIDGDGRTTYVRGAWHDLSTDGARGADAFEELLDKSGVADEILTAIARTAATAEPSQHAVSVPGLPPRWVRVLPIPSPHLAGAVHTLVAVVPESALDRAHHVPVARPADPPPRIDSLPVEHRAAVRPEAVISTAAPSPLGSSDAPRSIDVEPAVGSEDSARAARRTPGFFAQIADGLARAFRAPARTTGPVTVQPEAEVAAITPEPEPTVELLAQPGRSTQALAVGAGVLTYVAMQGLYLHPTYGWPSPLQGLLDSQECLVQPLCDNNVLRHNHLSVLALIGAITTFAFLFRRVGPRRLVTARPDSATAMASASWKFDRRGPGVFAWLAVLALALVTFQTVFADSVSTVAWVAATAFGAIAAWRADRDAAVPLGSTIAALAVGLSCLLLPLGIGAVWLGEHPMIGFVLILVGGAFFAHSLGLLRVSDSSFDAFDFSAMVVLSIVAAVLGLARHRSWRYAFIGDEWSFFEGALDGRRGNARLDTFDIGGPNDYFTGLTFELQSSVMQVAGDNVWGWRLSALMPMVLSVAAMYAFTRWLGGRTAALVAASALAAGHMLLSFSMIGYNNSQSLVAVSASFAALAWAHQRPSALRFFLLGSAVGSTFLVYAMARLALLPVGLLFLFLFRHDIASLLRRLTWSALGGLAMAAPALFSWRNWEALLKATPVQAEDPVLASGGVGRQVLENTFAGWLSFIGSTRNTHFIVGPHLDVISAILLIVGVGFVIARSRTDVAMRWFLIGGVGLWTAINAIQQYATISNTRSFMIPLVYCVFIGIGAAALLPIVIAKIPDVAPRRVLHLGVVAVLGVVMIALNQWHIGSHANERQQLTEQAMLVQQFEFTESRNGGGMPIYVGWPEQRNARLNMILRAHGIAAERIVVIPVDGTLNTEQLCAADEPVMLAMHQAHPDAIAWTDELAACWGTTPSTVTDPHGAPKLRRVTNPAGAAEFGLAPDRRFFRGADTGDFVLEDTIDVATDASGAAFALTRSVDGAAIHHLDTGRSFSLVQNQPIDFDITVNGLFVVAANGGDDRVVWYDGQGGVIRRYPGQGEMPMIGGIAIDGDGLWISDTTRSRVLRLDAGFKVTEVRSGQGAIIEPSALAAGPNDGVWVFSARTGEIVLIDDQDQAVVRIPAQVFAPADVPRLSSTTEGLLVRSVPERPVVELVDATGAVVDARGGINRPRAAATRTGELVIADPRWHEVPVLAVDERWAPAETGTVSWGTRAISADTEPLSSPFVSDELLQPGPVSTELVATEAVPVGDRQVWRSIGAEVLGEVHAVTTTAEGGVIVDVNGRMVRLDAQGAALELVSVSGGGSTFITDAATGDDDVVWVLDAGLGQVSRVAADGMVTVLQSDANLLRNARGAGAGAGDTLWVASTAAAQLVQLDSTGAIVTTLELPGRQPSDVAQAADGSLWMIDAQELELVHLTGDGEIISSLPLDSFSSVESPHIALGSDSVWVTEPEMTAAFSVDPATGQPSGERIEMARPDGARIDKPIGIAIGDDGRIWIPDSIGGAIIVLEQ